MLAPLDWGLGHATRCIPVIRQLLAQGHEVMLAGSGRSAALLSQTFPGLKLIPFEDYKISVPADRSLVWRMIIRLPLLQARINKERKALRNLIREHQPDLIISDNRYGLHHPEVKSILITHQLQLKLPAGIRFLEPLAGALLKRKFRHFDEIWVPDHEEYPGLAGELSHPRYHLPRLRYIGFLSRFSEQEVMIANMHTTKKYELMVLISGPEPQRSCFQELLTEQIRMSGIRACMITGRPGEIPESSAEGIDTFQHADDQTMMELISASEQLICRPGYSSLMDLMVWKRNAILVPTPGQTEQEYLGGLMMKNGWFFSCRQKGLVLKEALLSARQYHGFPEGMNPSAQALLPETL